MPFSLKSEQQRRETKSKERELFEKPALAKSAGWRPHQAQIYFKHCYLVPFLLWFWQGHCTLLQSLESMLWKHLRQVASNTWPLRASSRQPLPLWFTNVSSAGPQFQLVILVPDGLGQINGWCQLFRQAAIQLSRRSLPGPKPHPPGPRQPTFPQQVGAGPLPAGLKPCEQGCLHLGHGGQRTIEGLAEVSSLSLRDAVATILLHVEYTFVSAGYI